MSVYRMDYPEVCIWQSRGDEVRKSTHYGTAGIDMFKSESSICTNFCSKFVLPGFESKVERIAIGCYTVIDYGKCGCGVPTRQMRGIARRAHGTSGSVK